MIAWVSVLCSSLAWVTYFGYFQEPDRVLALYLFATAALMHIWHESNGIPWHQLRSRFPMAIASAMTLFSVTAAVQFLAYLVFERLIMFSGAQTIAWLALVGEWLSPVLGIQAAADNGQLYIQTNQHVYPVSVTPEKLGLPLTLLWLVSGLFVAGRAGRVQLRAIGLTVVLFTAYILLRLFLLVFLYRDYDSIELFWSPAWSFIAFLPLALIVGLLVPIGRDRTRAESVKYLGAPQLIVCTALAATLLILLSSLRLPPETENTRVLIDDSHSDWAWTNVVFDKESLTRRATYSYTNLVDYFRNFYSVDVNANRKIDDELLENVDVLIIKTPTKSFQQTEIDAIERFTRSGGGLFLIGDHTNLFGMTTNLNPLADRFGLRFADDDTFVLVSGETSSFKRAFHNTHPIAQSIGEFNFETSCTIMAPPHAEPVMVGYGLGREFVDYGHINFFGNMKADLEDGYGTYLQAVAVEFGRGRVFAFSDSTVFSNFSIFKPGRSELALAAVEYLRAGARPWWWRVAEWLFPILFVVLGYILIQYRRMNWSAGGLAVGVALGTWCGLLLVQQFHANMHQLPKPSRSVPMIIFDRELSNFRLPSMVETRPLSMQQSFSAFFVNMQRVSLIPRVKKELVDSLESSAPVVVINPLGSIRKSQARAVSEYFENGGRMLVMVNSDGPFYTTNALLSSLGVSVLEEFSFSVGSEREANELATERLDSSPPGAKVLGADRVVLPEQFFLKEGPVVYSQDIGAGRLVLIVGSEYFSQDKMGGSYNAPDIDEERLYRLQYYVVEDVLLSDTSKVM